MLVSTGTIRQTPGQVKHDIQHRWLMFSALIATLYAAAGRIPEIPVRYREWE